MKRARRRRQKAERQIHAAVMPSTDRGKLFAALGEELRRQAREHQRKAALNVPDGNGEPS